MLQNLQEETKPTWLFYVVVSFKTMWMLSLVMFNAKGTSVVWIEKTTKNNKSKTQAQINWTFPLPYWADVLANRTHRIGSSSGLIKPTICFLKLPHGDMNYWRLRAVLHLMFSFLYWTISGIKHFLVLFATFTLGDGCKFQRAARLRGS